VSPVTRAFQAGKIDLTSAAISLSFLLGGLGLLQFSYLLFFKKESKLSGGVIYLASIAFMALGVFAAIYSFVVPQDGYMAYKAGRAAGIFFIGLLGFKYARNRKRQNQPPVPTRGNGT
jgi:hypothetical protein